MKKQECIDYLNSIRNYLNLTSLCKEYNALYPNDIIDYNNLRNVINGVAPKRLSEEKLNKFISFLDIEIYRKKFLVCRHLNIHSEMVERSIASIVDEKSFELIKAISEALKNEL